MQPAEEFCTLVHEIAHEMLHRGDRRTLTTKQVRETEAEAVAFVVCQSVGLQNGTSSQDYIQLWHGDASLLRESLEAVQQTAAVILGGIAPEPAALAAAASHANTCTVWVSGPTCALSPRTHSPFALAVALGYRKEEFLSQDQVYDLASRPEFPSVYQLLPPPHIPFVWRTDSSLAAVEVYGPDGTSMLGSGGRKLQQPNLDSAVKFWQSFKNRANVRYFCFLGTQHGMINSISVSMNGAQMQASLPAEVPYSGDGTVPSWSAIWAHSQSLAVGGDHVGMMGDPHLHSTLDQVLGVTPPATYQLQIPTATISLRLRVVEIGTPFVAQVKFATARPIVKGSLHVEPQVGFSLSSATSQIIPIQVEMPTQRSMCLEFALQAPKVPSVYHVTWSEEDRVLAQADLIAQSREPLSNEQTLEFRAMSEKLK